MVSEMMWDTANHWEIICINIFQNALIGNDLPIRLYRQSFLRYQESFLLLGGYECEDSVCVEGCSCDDSACSGNSDNILRQV